MINKIFNFSIILSEVTLEKQIGYIFLFLGGLGAFLIGFKLISSNIASLAGNSLRKLFRKTTKNKMIGVGVGAGATALVQSSSATTVMIVGFVNAGIMTLAQVTPFIMGANIGTTVTTLIIGFGGASLKNYFIGLTGVGGFMALFAGEKEKVRDWGYVIAGFGLVFLGMEFMTDNMKAFLDSSRTFNNFLVNILTGEGWYYPFLLLFLGIALTAIVQSSSAVTGIVMSVFAALSIGQGSALDASNTILFIILGTNIGTCVTALISSLGANVNAKRASVIHLLFNVIGSMIFFVFLLCYKNFMADTFAKWFPGDSKIQIALFHFFFNLICAFLFLPFSNLFVKASEMIIRSKKETPKTNFLDERFLSTPSVAIDQVVKEIKRYGDIASSSLNISIEGFINKTLSSEGQIRSNIKLCEEINSEILDYLLRLSTSDIDLRQEKFVSGLHKAIIDISRQAEIADNFIKYTNKELNEEIEFSSSALEGITTFKNLLNEEFELAFSLFSKRDKKTLARCDEIETQMDKLRSKLISTHIKRLEEGKCSPSSNTIFINLVSNLERAGDHLNYIAHNIYQSSL